MLDAILQYATSAHFPSVFQIDKVSISHEARVLPQRMEGNQLHRLVMYDFQLFLYHSFYSTRICQVLSKALTICTTS